MRAYYTLLTSLPGLPPWFEVERPPISRPRLEARLSLLHPDDHAVASAMEGFLRWARLTMDTDAQEVVARAQTLVRQRDGALREIVGFRLGVRALVAALRQRRRGAPADQLGVVWPEVFARWSWRDALHVRGDDPELLLGHRYPWLHGLAAALADGDAIAAERQLLGAIWTHHTRLAEGAGFTFDAVLLYLCRWDILDRWSAYDAERGRARFERLLGEALGEQRTLFD